MFTLVGQVLGATREVAGWIKVLAVVVGICLVVGIGAEAAGYPVPGWVKKIAGVVLGVTVVVVAIWFLVQLL